MVTLSKTVQLSFYKGTLSGYCERRKRV